jgi:2-polyprenyl-3-methyl-5-hydroxy-6-metoxy-1,4-benzoquinol methylase
MNTAQHYNQKSVGYGIGHTRLKRILKLAGDVQGQTVLDAGCARGYLGRQLKERGARVVGFDISPEALKEAAQVLDETHVCNLEETWPLSSQSVDMVVLSEVLEHVFDPVSVLKEAHRVLKDDGKIIITTPNFMTWTNRLRFIFGLFRYENQGMFDFGHIRFFTYPYLREVLAASQFKVMEERHIIFPGKLTRFLRAWPGLFAYQFILKAKKI